jgi:ATP-dependent phosphofructokinase / diphosphate-dependent phosphofructokinase
MGENGRIERIGILTGGGDCPGLNAVIRAVVKTAVFRYKLEVVGFLEGYLGLIRNMTRRLEAADASGILHQGGTILGTSNRDNPFRFPVTVRGKKTFRDLSDQAIRNLKRNKIDALIAVGGDGSLTIAYQLYEKGVPVVGIPKTIDNDLWGTDVTFGFNTALQTAMEAIDKIQTTAASHHRVMVVEVMGRYAGWIALEAGIASGGDVVLIPEIPYDIDKICEVVRRRYRYGKRSSIVVVAEGAKPRKGQVVVRQLVADSTDPVRLGGVGYKIGNDIEEKTGLETRVIVLGHIQRGGSPIAFDRILATRYGSEAVDLVMKKKFGRMICLRGVKIGSIALKSVQNDQRKVFPNGDLVKTARSIAISFGD